MSYRVNTPNTSRTYPTLEQAKAAVLNGCPALKRGWTTKWVTFPERPTYLYFHVFNSQGALQTGAVIYPTA